MSKNVLILIDIIIKNNFELFLNLCFIFKQVLENYLKGLEG